ncbi:glycosyltransferase family 2 protein [Methylovorus glucosotrophus]|uniref:Glycosyl transferase family 2 n=1 Tax=Methylovorus glucosotrophus (strain SIP3-4) TaxID=582744 RepID=C6X8A6_METGS|nr:glycosyltransferase family 2 protein [Methylovorus glucosotrophus]ACT49376.1 glycosyl transferase family 2 [Methylovorus glucosotrophus SIP3-4]
MKISVAIATYQGSKYLREQLDSIAQQTVLPDEVIIYDDASSDDTANEAELYSQTSPFLINVFRQAKNVGFRENFDSALCACCGDLVFLCDQDDVWLPNKIESVLNVFQTHTSAVLVIHDLEFCDEQLRPIGQTKIKRMASGHNIYRDYVVGMATAIRGDFLRLCLPVPDVPGLAHDRWLHDCALAIKGKVVIEEPLALYRRHGANATADTVVNSALINNNWAYFSARFNEPSLLKKTPCPSYSPLISWLSKNRETLLAQEYIDEIALQNIITRENRKMDVIKARSQLLQRPRLLRITGIAKLFLSGGYSDFFTRKSAIKDLLRP